MAGKREKKNWLNADEIREAVSERLRKYESLNLLESYAMFMGVAQLLEMALKSLLERKYGYDPAKTRRYTLGRTAKELKSSGLRADFIRLLNSVVDYRNYIAHEMLANDALITSIVGESGHLESRYLEKGIYELEQLAYLYEVCEEHDAWQ